MAARGTLGTLMEMHVKHRDEGDDIDWCKECEKSWPCPTIQVITGEEPEEVDHVGDLKHSVYPSQDYGWAYYLLGNEGEFVVRGVAMTKRQARKSVSDAAREYNGGKGK